MSGRINKGLRYQAPRGPKKLSYGEERALAEANRQKMMDLMRERGAVSVKELMQHLEFSPAKVREYANRLIGLGLVKSELLVFMGQKHSAPSVQAMYSLVGQDEDDDAADQPKRVIRQKYELHHVRHPQDIAFFGPARKSA